ncbi:MAG: magnesium/cobalt transporter CorA [Nocardioides sp.]|uniref:magnesium/cobalt transporter CorA n=1 Tax=Nocardioides sp. TaxID=35761 RepID=UPI0039E66F1F
MIVDSAVYRNGIRVPLDCKAEDLHEIRAGITEPGDFVWVGLREPNEAEIEDVAVAFRLHPLAVEDAVSAHQRPKLEHYEGSLFITLKTLWYVDEHDAVETGEINIFLGPDFIVTVRHGDGANLHDARLRLEERPSVLALGPGAALYAITDLIVDEYEVVAAALEDDVDEIEASVFSERRTSDSARIYTLKREIAEVRRAVLPLRDPMRRFSVGQVPGVPSDASYYFRDVADHLIRVSETIDSLDVLLSAAFEANLAGISVQQNEDMRRISAGVALVVVPTLIAGIYGMNFHYMPELDWVWGYPMALGLMLLSVTGLWVFFKRSGWL